MVNTSLDKAIIYIHTPFSRFIPLKTFRYGMTGGSNAVLNLAIFYISYNYLFERQNVVLPGISITPYIAAYIVALSITFPIGFLLNKYFVFQEINGRTGKQLFLYFALTSTNIVLEYILLHFLIGKMKLPATLAQGFIIVLLASISYLFQTYVTFRKITDQPGNA
ncbi:GtrA family protein [Pedobacter sp. AW31-3R]|uniref:GtrA family protein n=1 Tax=Pedobacter sp. AW31-3R TaxID=3445781 RepID=UPI003FA152D7